MSEPKPDREPSGETDEAELAAYLERHPDFLQRYPQALQAQELHHEAGSAVSLIERQASDLRRTNQQMQSRLKDLIAAARDNELRVQHLNSLARALIAADTPASLVEGLTDCLHRELGVDALYIGVMGGDEVEVGGIQALRRDSAQMHVLVNVFRRGKPICGPLTEEQVEALFPDQEDIPPQSAALIPLGEGEGEVRGVLALASRDSRRFVPEMGTWFLELAGQLVTAACRRHLGSNRL
jgi:hypothetical protein